MRTYTLHLSHEGAPLHVEGPRGGKYCLRIVETTAHWLLICWASWRGFYPKTSDFAIWWWPDSLRAHWAAPQMPEEPDPRDEPYRGPFWRKAPNANLVVVQDQEEG